MKTNEVDTEGLGRSLAFVVGVAFIMAAAATLWGMTGWAVVAGGVGMLLVAAAVFG